MFERRKLQSLKEHAWYRPLHEKALWAVLNGHERGRMVVAQLENTLESSPGFRRLRAEVKLQL